MKPNRREATQMAKLRVMDPRKGDTVLEWDRTDEKSVEAAKAEFDRIIGKNFGRHVAYKVDSPGGTRRSGEPIKEFDPNAEEILMVPPLQGGC